MTESSVRYVESGLDWQENANEVDTDYKICCAIDRSWLL